MASILVCDDALFMRKVLSNLIKEMGHQVVGQAANGEEAVELYSLLRPDLVTMDITMPVLDGLGAVKRIMATDPHAKIIMVSAMGQQAMVVDAIRSGARDFIVKPYAPERVKLAFERILGPATSVDTLLGEVEALLRNPARS